MHQLSTCINLCWVTTLQITNMHLNLSVSYYTVVIDFRIKHHFSEILQTNLPSDLMGNWENDFTPSWTWVNLENWFQMYNCYLLCVINDMKTFISSNANQLHDIQLLFCVCKCGGHCNFNFCMWTQKHMTFLCNVETVLTNFHVG